MEKTKYYITQRFFDEDGKLHRDHGPAVVYKSVNGDRVNRVDYYEHGNYIRSVKFSKGRVSEKIFNSKGLTKIKYKNKEDTEETTFTYSNGNTVTEKVINNGEVISISYKHNGRFNRMHDAPSLIIIDNKRGIHYQMYYKNDKLHNEHGPARVVYSYFDSHFELEEQEYYIDGKKVDDFSYLVKLGSSLKSQYQFQEKGVD